MESFRLTTGLLLPWLAGYLWLRAIEQRLYPEHTPNTLRQLGYGLFLGYAALQGIILATATIFDHVNYWTVLSIVALLTAPPATLLFTTASVQRPAIARSQQTSSRIAKALLIFLAAWTALHLCLAAIEIFNRPVYPWDAWLSWAYRAKTWFYSGTVFQLANPTEWLQGVNTTHYNAVGNRYPSFASIMAFWAAISLGQWSETLVNTPVLLCGIALAMGLYGQCRERGISPLLSTIAIYALLSIPIVGTHLALAGQADIWVTGFAGLGFAAISRGLSEDNNQKLKLNLGLGVAMVGLTIANKNEGYVWFAATLILIPMVLKPRLSLQVFALVFGLSMLAWLTGVTYVEIPIIGALGFAEGRLYIPIVGSISLQQFEVWDDYLKNFFLNGTWHLLWPLTIVSLLALLVSVPKGRLRRSITCFYMVFIATQGLIFWLTAQGQWADDSTAINRLPMHVAPALVFCLILVAHKVSEKLPSNQGGDPKYRSPGSWLSPLSYTPPLIAILLTTASIFTYLYSTTPPGDADSNTTSRVFNPQKIKIVVGSGELRGNVGVINEFNNGIAIVSSGPISLDASALSSLQIVTGGDNRVNAGFFWRRQGDSANVESLALSYKGKQSIDLGQTPEWIGTITEIGLIFYEDEGRAAELHSLVLSPKTISTELQKMWRDWMQFEPWSQASAHWVAAGSRATNVSLPLVVSIWLFFTYLLFLLIGRGYKLPVTTICFYALVGWMLLDLRWTANGLKQSRHTLAYFQEPQVFPYLDLGDDKKIASLMFSAKKYLDKDSDQVVIFSADPALRFQVLRAKYHLLPIPSVAHEGAMSTMPKRFTNHVLIINKTHLEPGKANSTSEKMATDLQWQLKTQVRTVLSNETGTLFQISPKTAQ